MRTNLGLPSGTTIAGYAVPPWHFTDATADAGAIQSDLADMVRYLRCNLGQGPLAQACLFAQQPRSSFPGHGIGLAWMTNLQTGFIDHNGATNGYRAPVVMSGDRLKRAVVLSSGPAAEDIGAYVINAGYPVTSAQTTVAAVKRDRSEVSGRGADASKALDVHGVRRTAT